jgi:hypothetical protein
MHLGSILANMLSVPQPQQLFSSDSASTAQATVPRATSTTAASHLKFHQRRDAATSAVSVTSALATSTLQATSTSASAKQQQQLLLASALRQQHQQLGDMRSAPRQQLSSSAACTSAAYLPTCSLCHSRNSSSPATAPAQLKRRCRVQRQLQLHLISNSISDVTLQHLRFP